MVFAIYIHTCTEQRAPDHSIQPSEAIISWIFLSILAKTSLKKSASVCNQSLLGMYFVKSFTYPRVFPVPRTDRPLLSITASLAHYFSDRFQYKIHTIDFITRVPP